MAIQLSVVEISIAQVATFNVSESEIIQINTADNSVLIVKLFKRILSGFRRMLRRLQSTQIHQSNILVQNRNRLYNQSVVICITIDFGCSRVHIVCSHVARRTPGATLKI